MAKIDLDKLKDQLIEHEGLHLKPYRCPGGYWTIGVGRNLEGKGITSEEAVELFKHGIKKSQASMLLENDIDECIANLKSIFPHFKRLKEGRQRALIDMRFNLGPSRFRTFKKMIAALHKRDYYSAAREMLDSRWASQVGRRAHRLAKMMEEGI